MCENFEETGKIQDITVKFLIRLGNFLKNLINFSRVEIILGQFK